MKTSNGRTFSPYLINYFPFAMLPIGNILWRLEIYKFANVLWKAAHDVYLPAIVLPSPGELCRPPHLALLSHRSQIPSQKTLAFVLYSCYKVSCWSDRTIHLRALQSRPNGKPTTAGDPRALIHLLRRDFR
jgi:hypothetical protein